LIETLMVVSLIGMLVALLLPAVQAAREQARANSCRQRLSQLWLATQMYHTKFRCFPAGTLSESTPIRQFPAGYHHGWLVQIRPLLAGGRGFSERLDPAESIYAPVNWPLREAFAMDLFACPSSPYGFDYASYAAIHDGRAVPIEATSRGAFVANRFLQADDFPDGLSTTLFLGEQRTARDQVDGLGWMSGTQSTLRTTGVPLRLRRPPDASPVGTQLGFPYAAFAADGAPNYEAFVRRVAGDPQLDLDQLAPADWQRLSERAQTMDPPPSVLSQQEGSENAGGETPSGGGYGGGGYGAGGYGGGGYGAVRSPTYPLLPLGPQSLAPQGLGSYHPDTVHGVTGDGKVVALASTIDAALLRGLGIRDDAAPLMLPATMQY